MFFTIHMLKSKNDLNAIFNPDSISITNIFIIYLKT